MLAPNFVESEIKSWIEENRPNLVNLNDLLPRLAFKIIQAYELYKHMNSKYEDRYGIPDSIVDEKFLSFKDDH